DGDEEDDGDDGKEGDGDDDDENDDGEEGNDDNDDQEIIRDDDKDDEKDDEEEGGDDEQEYDEEVKDDETRDEESNDNNDDQEIVRDDDKDDEKDDEEEGGDDEQEYDEEVEDDETRDEESFDPIPKTPKNSDDEGNGDEDLGLNVGGEEGYVEEEEEDELYRDININQGGVDGDDGKEGDGNDDDENNDGEEGNDNNDDQEIVRDDDKDDEKDDEEEGGDDEQEYDEEVEDDETRDEESFDPIPKTPKNSDDEGNGDEDLGLNVGGEEGYVEEEEEDKLYRDININQGRGIQTTLEVKDSHVTLTLVNPDGQQQSSSVSSQFVTSMLNPTLDVGMESIFETTSQMDVQTPTSVAPLPITAPTMTPSTIATITTTSQAPILPTISDRLRDKAQRENDEFLKSVDENMQKIIKEQVKEQVKTSYAVATDLTEMELKKIIIEKMEGNNVMMMLIKMKNPPLDQTGGPRDVEKERSLSQQVLLWKLLPRALAGQHKGLNLDRRRQSGGARYHLEEVFKATTDQLDWVNPEGQQYPHNLLKPLPLIQNNRGRHVIPFEHFINNDLEYLRRGASSRKYTTSITKTKRRIIAVTELKIVEWHNYNHLDWITVQRDDDKLYKFKEGNFKRLRIQDIEDMLLLLVQGKLTNLTVEECFAFNVFLRMFTRIIVIQRRVEDLQLGVESYQKKHNLTKSYSYQSDLKSKEAYTAYSNPRGFINQNKDKKNRLMRIDELHKFSDGMLTDVRTALDDRLKGIRMQYLPQSIWRKSDKE
nr:hypothetical protein [Tanacetum cinerariifolium]